MSKVKQIAVYLTENRAKQLKDHHKTVNSSGKLVSLSSIVREVVDDFLDELNLNKGDCGCSVCEEGKEQKKEKVSSELAAAFGFNKELQKERKPKKVKNKKTVPTSGTKETIHSVGPAKTTKVV